MTQHTQHTTSQHEQRKRRIRTLLSLCKLALLLLILVALPVYIYVFHRDTLAQFDSFDAVLTFLRRYHTESILVYIGIQVLQIVISIIPGQAFQFAAGYLYTFFPGLLFSLIGAILGTFLSFYLARLLGADAVHLFFGEERMHYFLERLNSRRAYTIVFLLYLIPGLPKDVVSYAAGVSDMPFKPFLILSLAGRTPGMAGSLLIGALYFKGHMVAMWCVVALAVILFCVCILCRKRIHSMLDRFYDRIAKP